MTVLKLENVLFAICSICAITSRAQDKHIPIMNLLAEKNNFKMLSYNYSMTMVNHKQALEEMKGVYYRDGANYKDSNARYVQVLENKIFYKVDHKLKMAVVYNTKLFTDKMKFTRQTDESILGVIIDSSYRLVKLSTIDTATRGKSTLTYFLTKDSQYEWIKFVYDKHSYKLLSLSFSMKAETGGQNNVDKHVIYELNNMKFGENKRRIEMPHFFIKNGQEIKLSPTLKNYKLSVVMS